MESLKVSSDSLRKLASEVDGLADTYGTQYGNLIKDVTTLTSSDYQSEDADQFREKVEGFKPDFDKMKQLMNDYADFLRKAAQSYDDDMEARKAQLASLQ